MTAGPELRARLDAHDHRGTETKRLAYKVRRAINAQDYEAAADYLDQIEAIEHPASIGTGEESGEEYAAWEDNSFLSVRGKTTGLSAVYDLSNNAAESAGGLLTNGNYYTASHGIEDDDDLGGFFPDGQLVDPSGLLQTDPYPDPDYWGVTHPANTVFLFPPGVYAWYYYINISGTHDADTRVYLNVDGAYFYLSEGTDEWRKDGGLWVNHTMPLTSALAVPSGAEQSGQIMVTEGAPVPYIFYYQVSGFTSPPFIRASRVMITKIG